MAPEEPPKAEIPSWLKWLLVIASVSMIFCFSITLALFVTQKPVPNDVSSLKTTIAQLSSVVQQISARQDLSGQGVTSYAISHVTPRKIQWFRGTCWDFSTVSVLEHAYRVQGIASGYLKPAEYVRLSEQAYGNRMIAYCQRFPTVCMTAGDRIAFNSTEGGEVPLLYVFQKYLANTVVPDSVCPYIKFSDNSSCPNLDLALRANPIKFQIDKFSTLYKPSDIKQAVRNSDTVLGFSVSVHTAAYYIPCTDASDAACNPSTCTRCPVDKSFGTVCCKKYERDMFNMDGEFLAQHDLNPEGGHAMTLVGYNDEFVTHDGSKGGFIMRNSWADGMTAIDEFGKVQRKRGSHSIPYFLQQISEIDERRLCPNAENPRNWYTCAGQGDCDSPSTLLSAQLANQSLTLTCRDVAMGCEANTLYYTANVTFLDDELTQMCFFSYKPDSKAWGSLCLPEQPIDFVAGIFKPVDAEDYKNDDDFCGYYFFPYKLLDRSVGQLKGFFVNQFSIKFHEQSFAANSAKYPSLDYSFIRKSTYTQKSSRDFVVPFGNYPDLPLQL